MTMTELPTTDELVRATEIAASGLSEIDSITCGVSACKQAAYVKAGDPPSLPDAAAGELLLFALDMKRLGEDVISHAEKILDDTVSLAYVDDERSRLFKQRGDELLAEWHRESLAAA